MSETGALPNTTKSEAMHQAALGLFPGGVNSPVRAYRAVGVPPRILVSAHGARMTDADGNELLDYVLGWGPMLLGHGHPDVVAAVERQLRAGVLFGMTSPLEIELAERVRRFYPAAERLRFVSSRIMKSASISAPCSETLAVSTKRSRCSSKPSS